MRNGKVGISDIDITKIFKEPVKRSELKTVFDCSDREARLRIAKLMEHYNIVNLQDGRGYFLADDETAIKYAMQERHRGIMSLKKANMILSRCESGQFDMVVPVKAHYRRINKTRFFSKNQIELF